MGVELDLRSRNDRLILEHDPFKLGEDFEGWLSAWTGQLLVLNIKEEGLEEKILELLITFRIDNYFFLDQSFPFMQKLIRKGNTRVAARCSDIESIETVLKSGAQWCWLDSFTGDWRYLIDAVPQLIAARIKTCLVSPELQRPESTDELPTLKKLILKKSLEIDAVCTKYPELWK
jgi:hypothetical protein